MSPRTELDVDLYTDEAILDPHPLYRAIRDRAAAVWLPAHRVWALGRFEDVFIRMRGSLTSMRRTRATSARSSDSSNVLRGYASFRAAFR